MTFIMLWWAQLDAVKRGRSISKWLRWLVALTGPIGLVVHFLQTRSIFGASLAVIATVLLVLLSLVFVAVGVAFAWPATGRATLRGVAANVADDCQKGTALAGAVPFRPGSTRQFPSRNAPHRQAIGSRGQSNPSIQAGTGKSLDQARPIVGADERRCCSDRVP